MIWRRSILLIVYGVGARSHVTEGVWKAVEKGGTGGIGNYLGERAEFPSPRLTRPNPHFACSTRERAVHLSIRL